MLTEEAEIAISLLSTTIAMQRAVAGQQQYPLPHPRLGQPDVSYEQFQLQSALVRIVTITESFCRDRLLQKAQNIVDPSRHNIVNRIWDEASQRATGTWRSQVDSYWSWFQIRLNYDEIRGYVDVRNAVAHGLGVLTSRQRDVGTRARLANLGISIVDDRIVLTFPIIIEAARACRRVIEAIDHATR